MNTIADYFGSMTFDDRVMKARLSAGVYASLKKTIDQGERLNAQVAAVIERGEREKLFWKEEIAQIQEYTKEQAISELIKAKKIREKISQIEAYVRGLQV